MTCAKVFFSVFSVALISSHHKQLHDWWCCLSSSPGDAGNIILIFHAPLWDRCWAPARRSTQPGCLRSWSPPPPCRPPRWRPTPLTVLSCSSSSPPSPTSPSKPESIPRLPWQAFHKVVLLRFHQHQVHQQQLGLALSPRRERWNRLEDRLAATGATVPPARAQAGAGALSAGPVLWWLTQFCCSGTLVLWWLT